MCVIKLKSFLGFSGYNLIMQKVESQTEEAAGREHKEEGDKKRETEAEIFGRNEEEAKCSR